MLKFKFISVLIFLILTIKFLGGNLSLSLVKAQDLNNPPQTISVIPNSGWSTPGTWQNFTVQYADLDGVDDIHYAGFIIGDPNDPSKIFHLRYDSFLNRVSLYNFSLNTWVPPEGAVLGSTGVITNRYGSLSLNTTAIKNGNTLTITWPISLNNRKSGVLQVLGLNIIDKEGLNSGFGVDKPNGNVLGEWIVNYRPSLIAPELINQTVTTNTWYLFNPRYKDLDGKENLKNLYFLIGKKWDLNNSVYLKYNRQEDKLYLWTDNSWQPAGGITPRTDFLLENNWVKIRGPATRIGVYDVKTLTVKWSLSFKPSFLGQHPIYLKAEDIFGETAGGETAFNNKGWIEIR